MEMKQLELIKKIAVFLVLPFFLISMAGCSGDEGKGEEPDETTLPYWVLGTGNPNMPSSGTIIAQYSDAPVGSDISKLVDNDVNTKYLTHHSSFDIIWNGNNNVAVLAYSLASASDSPEMDPKSWTLYGSLDSKVWKTIDKQENQVFSDRKAVKSFEVDNGVSYRYYKLSVQSNNGGTATQISEFVLSAATFSGNMDDLMPHASGNTYTASTPMGTQHVNDREAGAADLAWLKDASQEPATFAGLPWASFPVGSLYPFGDPNPADVNQHVIGDCSACAAMASIAYLFPRFIKQIIKANSDNTFTVTLYDPKGKAVEVGVSNSFVADGSKLGACSGKNDQVTWATVIEKAVIKWKQIYSGSSDIGGIGTEYFTAIVTGNGTSFAFSPDRLSAADLQRAALVSLQQRKIVVGGFTENGKPIDNKYTSVNGHAYSFHPPKDNSYLFTMRNPWGLLPLIGGGYSNGREDGLLNIGDDGLIPPLIDLRICDPGAAKGYAYTGDLEPYTPPVYTPAPMHVAYSILQIGR
ncbi:MAG: hypothetical protein LBL79_01665 [Prevotella sp.]|nr:hypothetical protein [Prevotella sp.]